MEQQSNILEQMKGILEGTGTHFEITNSEYLNITLDSSKEIKIRLESIPEMITLNILEPNNKGSTFLTEITISGLNPNTTYHKYEDHYYNHEAFTTDESGSYSYNLDVSKSHLVFIQPRPSTYYLREAGWFDDIGPLPSTIATWDSTPGVRTATLETDITGQSIEIEVDNAILDGKGYTTTGSGTSNGIFLGSTIQDITIKNFQITNFSNGVLIDLDNINITISNISLFNNYFGIKINANISNTIIENNNIYDNDHTGIWLVENNSNNIIEDNNIYNNRYGIVFSEFNTFNTINNNIIRNIQRDAIYFYSIVNNENKIFNNCILNNKLGLHIRLQQSNLNRIEFNNFINSPNTNARNYGNNYFYSNYWDNYTTPGFYNITPTGQDDNPSSSPIHNIPITTEITLTGTEGDNDWYVSDIEAELAAKSSPCTGDIDKTYYSLDGTNFNIYTSPITISGECITTIYYYSKDTSGIKEPTKTKEIKIDVTPPVITINVPADGSEYVLGQIVPADCSANDVCSGVASAIGTEDNGDPIDTSSLGWKTFTVNATDNAGNSTSLTTKYKVIIPQRGIELDKFLIKKELILKKD